MEVAAEDLRAAPPAGAKLFPTWDCASVALLVGTGLVMLATLDDYGLTYDEPPHIRYGERILSFYTSGFTQRDGTNSSYVGGFDLLAALLRRISPFDAVATNHFACVFVAQCGLIGTWKIGRLLGGSLVGLCSLIFLLLIPAYYGHQFNNPKDVPFAAGYIWGLYYIAKWLEEYSPWSATGASRRPSASFFLRLGLALGAGMSVRVGGALLIAYLGLFLGLVLIESKRVHGVIPWSQLKHSAGPLAAALGLSWLLMVVLWPKAILSPLAGPADAAKKVTHFELFDSPTFFRGRMISSHDVPWDYLPTYFVQQLPEFTIVCLLASMAWIALQSYRALTQRQALPLTKLLLIVATLLPPTYAAVRHSVLYDGLRHFLFLMPPIAVLSALGFSKLVRQCGRRPAIWVVVSCFGLFVVDQAYALVRLHPHQHVFFNRTSGGTKVAVKRYETEYYGSVYRELNSKLRDYLWTTQRDRYLDTTFAVTGCGSKLFFAENLPLNFRYVPMGKLQDADIYASYPRDRCMERLKERPELLRVVRDGATLGVARSLNKKLDPTATTPGARNE